MSRRTRRIGDSIEPAPDIDTVAVTGAPAAAVFDGGVPITGLPAMYVVVAARSRVASGVVAGVEGPGSGPANGGTVAEE